MGVQLSVGRKGRVKREEREERPDAAENGAEKAGKGFSSPERIDAAAATSFNTENPSLPLPLWS